MNKFELWQGDCLELMKNITDGTVDLVLTDPPLEWTSKAIDEKKYMQKSKETKRLIGLTDILQSAYV